MDASDPDWPSAPSEAGVAEAILPSPCQDGGFGEQLGRLYSENMARLHAFLTRRLGNSGDAEDIAHEAFARMLKRYGDGGIDSPVAMLYRIAVNIVRDGARLERFRTRQCQGLIEPVCAVPPEDDPESAASARQRLKILKHGIDQLPPRCREVFLLYKFGGKSHSEIANHLGISRNMVEKHVIRAYSQLRQAVTDSDGDS
jgi:RNA polymerase sigma factor (sigma-70 family)